MWWIIVWIIYGILLSIFWYDKGYEDGHAVGYSKGFESGTLFEQTERLIREGRKRKRKRLEEVKKDG